MSMNTCRCGEVYDTDEQMETDKGECICDRCWEDMEDKHDEGFCKSLDDHQNKG